MYGYLAAEHYRPQVTSVENFREPNDGTLRYRPGGAMPADPFASEFVKRRQRRIDGEFQKLFDFPPDGTPQGFAQMLADDHLIGEERRKLKNFEGYMQWRSKHEPISPELDAKIDHVVQGDAYVSEIFDYAMQTGVMNFEVGKVTHPYRRRLEHVETLRNEVADALEAVGGELYPKILPYHSLSIVPSVEYHKDGTYTLHGFIVRYKRDFGRIFLPDNSGVIHLVERQIAGFRVDAASGFEQSVKMMLDMNSEPFVDPWLDTPQYLHDSGATSFITHAVQSDSLEQFVVPISTTIYGYKELFDHPTKRRLAMQAVNSAHPVDVDGIAYFGPPHSILKFDETL